MTLTLTYVIKVTTLSDLQKVLAVGHCLLRSYKQIKFHEFHVIFEHVTYLIKCNYKKYTFI